MPLIFFVRFCLKWIVWFIGHLVVVGFDAKVCISCSWVSPLNSNAIYWVGRCLRGVKYVVQAQWHDQCEDWWVPPAEMLGNEVKVAGEGASLLSKDKGITPIKNVSISDLEEHNTPISLSSTYGSTSETPIDLSTDVTTSLLSKGSLLLETQLTLMFLSRCWRRPLR